MIFYYNAIGVPLSVAPENVYQGSNKANTLYFVCPIAQTSAVTVNFVLPDDSTVSNIMSAVPLEGTIQGETDNVGIWKLDLTREITSQYGVLQVSFSVNCVDVSFNTASINVIVEKGINPQPVTEDENQDQTDLIQSILSYIANINVAVENLSQKQDKLSAGENITIDENNVISANIFVPKPTSYQEVQNVLRQGHVEKVLEVADQFETKTVTNITASVGESQGIVGVTIDESKAIPKISEYNESVIILTFNGLIWVDMNAQSQSLTEWGISVEGSPINGDAVVLAKTSKNISWDILGFDQCVSKDQTKKHVIVLGAHDIFSYNVLPFSAQQLMYATAQTMPAGNYKFSLEKARFCSNLDTYDGSYIFKISSEIPAGGGFRHKSIGGEKDSYSQNDVLGNYIVTYKPVSDNCGAKIQDNVTVYLNVSGYYDNGNFYTDEGLSDIMALVDKQYYTDVISGVTYVCDGSSYTEITVTDLGKFTRNATVYNDENLYEHIVDDVVVGYRNSTERQVNGSNRWRDSVVRQWLNSDAPSVSQGETVQYNSNWWKPQSVFDRVPINSNVAGFLFGLEKEFVDALGEVELKTVLDSFDANGTETYDVTYDKVWLPATQNVKFDYDYSYVEGRRFTLFDGASEEEIAKSYNSVLRDWFVRSRYLQINSGISVIRPSGKVGVSKANSQNRGIVPFCCII